MDGFVQLSVFLNFSFDFYPVRLFEFSVSFCNRLSMFFLFMFTVDSLLMDTSVKRTLRVGPCLSLLPLFDSL